MDGQGVDAGGGLGACPRDDEGDAAHEQRQHRGDIRTGRRGRRRQTGAVRGLDDLGFATTSHPLGPCCFWSGRIGQSGERPSGETLGEVLADAQGVGDDRQRRVHRADRREEARVDDVEVVELVGLAVRRRAPRSPGRSRTATVPAWWAVAAMSIASWRYSLRSVRPSCIPRSVSIDSNFLRSRFSPSVFVSIEREPHRAVVVDGDAGCRGAGGPPTTARSRRCGARPSRATAPGSSFAAHCEEVRRLALQLLAVGLAEHLDAAPRVVGVLALEVPVVERQRLLEPRGVRLLRQRHHRHVVVAHVVAPDLVRAVGEPVRMRVVRRPQQQQRRVQRAARHHDHVAREARPRSRRPSWPPPR